MPQRTCIYCSQVCDVSEFNTEHVIPQAFGRFEQNLTLDCVCSECNAHFGRTIDLALGRDSIEALLRFFHDVKPASEGRELRQQRLTVTLGDDPDWTGCRLDVVEEDEDAVVTLVPQVRFGLRGGGWLFITEAVLSDETKSLPEAIDPTNVRLISNSVDTDERLIAVLAKRGIRFETRSVSGPPPSMCGLAPLDVRMKFDQIILRSIGKIAFNYAASAAGAAFVLGDAFDVTRAYIRYGTQPPYPVVIPRSEPILADESPTERRARAHLLTVGWAGEPNALVGQVSLFNGPTYSVSLARGHSGLWLPIKSGHYFDLETRRIGPLVAGSHRRRVVVPRRRDYR
jgi:HNH endonuclease